jgi:predicted lipid-binding transport protein (Tim44 family)
MKLLGALFAMVLIVTGLAVAALVQLVITLAPVLMVALVVVLMLRTQRPARPSPPITGWPHSGYPRRVAPQPQYRVGAPAAAPGGWVMVPVWIAPTPGPPVIDAEVIGDRD